MLECLGVLEAEKENSGDTQMLVKNKMPGVGQEKRIKKRKNIAGWRNSNQTLLCPKLRLLLLLSP
jgi:hypothetical protein